MYLLIYLGRPSTNQIYCWLWSESFSIESYHSLDVEHWSRCHSWWHSLWKHLKKKKDIQVWVWGCLMHVLKEIHIYIIIIILIFTFRHEQTSCCQHWKKHITTVNLVMMTPSRILKLQSYIMKVFIFFNKKVLISSKRNSEVYSHSVPVVSLELNMLVFAGQ